MNKKSGRTKREFHPVAGLKSYCLSTKGQVSLLSFFLPFLAMICIFAGNKIYPFGDRSFLRTDLYHQYAPFFAELQRKLQHGGSLFYTWNIGMGTNFVSLIGYYLSSFSHLFVVFFPEDLILEYLSYEVVFKMGLAGLSFTWLLRNHRHEDREDYKMPFFSLFYAMSGYLAAYSWNIMWMDCIWLAPLVLLGIERLVKEKKYFLYVIALGAAILSNYYIAIMICIFCVLYFFVQLTDLLIDTPEGQKLRAFFSAGFRFAFCSLLAGALAAVILIPEIKALGLTSSSDISFPKSWTSYFSIFEMLGRHLIDVECENGLDHWPNIYCGIGVLLCIPIYYMSKKCRTSEKISRTALLVFMLFSFSMNVPNFIWHGFHYPNSLPCRQSFLYIAIVLIMCYEALSDINEVTAKMTGQAFFIGGAFIVLCEMLLEDDAYRIETFYLSLVFLGIYAAILLAYKKRPKLKTALFVGLLIIAFVESIVNMAVTSVTTVSRSEYLNYRDSYAELVEQVESFDSGFYRFEKVARKSKNDGAFVGYPSISTFSSVSYGNVSDFYKHLGMESSMNAYSNNGITPLMNSLFAVKYILTTTSQQESQLMTLFDQNEECYVYENLYTMGAGFMLPAGFNIDWNTGVGTAIKLQNEFSNLNGHDDIFKEITDTSSIGDTMDIFLDETCHVFVQLTNKSIDNVTSNINGSTKDYSHTKRGFLIDLGYLGPDDEVSIYTTDDEDMKAEIYYLDEEALIDLIRDLKDEELQITRWTDTKVEGTIEVLEDGQFFLSIAYDPGWTIKVDGEKIDYYKFQDSFICFDLSAGSHKIEMSYCPDGLILGLVISLAALAILVLLIVLKKNPKFAEPITKKLSEKADALEKRRALKEQAADALEGDDDFEE